MRKEKGRPKGRANASSPDHGVKKPKGAKDSAPNDIGQGGAKKKRSAESPTPLSKAHGWGRSLVTRWKRLSFRAKAGILTSIVVAFIAAGAQLISGLIAARKEGAPAVVISVNVPIPRSDGEPEVPAKGGDRHTDANRPTKKRMLQPVSPGTTVVPFFEPDTGDSLKEKGSLLVLTPPDRFEDMSIHPTPLESQSEPIVGPLVEDEDRLLPGVEVLPFYGPDTGDSPKGRGSLLVLTLPDEFEDMFMHPAPLESQSEPMVGPLVEDEDRRVANKTPRPSQSETRTSPFRGPNREGTPSVSGLPKGLDDLMVEQYFTPTGWIGDGQLDIEHISLLDAWAENAHSGPLCTKITYQEFGNYGWGGVYWQNTADSWGEQAGVNLSAAGYKSISFWARGEQGTEYVEFGAGGIERAGFKYKDSFFATAGKILLTTEWQRHYIDLEGKDLSSVIGGFYWVAGQTGNASCPTFYIDDICFTREPAPKLDYLDIGRFFTASGWMGDGELRTHGISLAETCGVNPHSRPACIRVAYTRFNSLGWGGVYWQNRQNNWGDQPGWDLSKEGYRRITFWARGETGNEIVEFRAGGISDKNKPYKDSFVASCGRIPLTTDWRQYAISLEGKDLSSVIGAFCWVAGRPDNPNGLTFYIDDIRFEK
jgi:hypothetical protein